MPPQQNQLSLRQRLSKKTLLGEISLNTNTSTNTSFSSLPATNPDFRQINPDYWLKKYRKDFPTFTFFLDNLDDKHQKSLERKIILLGAKSKAFFSKACTHLITTKPFYEVLSSPGKAADHAMVIDSQDQENVKQPSDNSSDLKSTFAKKPNTAKDPSQQAFFDTAHSLGIEVWSLTRTLCVVSALMNKRASHGPVIDSGAPHETLNKMLLEEKRYGVSTGHRNGQAHRPTFVTFNNYYAKVEDVAGVHCPILVKEFPTPVFDPDTPENERIYPWPKLYVISDAQVRSPFSPPDRSKQIQSKHHVNMKPPQQQPAHNMAGISSKNCIPSNTILSHNKHQHTFNPCQQNNLHPEYQENNLLAPALGTLGPASADISILTSKTPFTTNSTNQSFLTQRTRSISTNLTNSQTTLHAPGVPLYDNVSRLDRRMVTNQRKGLPGGDAKHLGTVDDGTGIRSVVAAKAAHDQAERRKKDLARRTAKENSKYCENCVAYYQDLEKHLQEESHLGFVRDQNNFKDLDIVLESTRRSHLRT
ncbi:hypothetical protein BC941DRAFT_467188 [Chlamydoabsidia padenii]|nr:hypothetical protein BC941DRAFT_467188 [Chlamydoabsidia padenii]